MYNKILSKNIIILKSISKLMFYKIYLRIALYLSLKTFYLNFILCHNKMWEISCDFLELYLNTYICKMRRIVKV